MEKYLGDARNFMGKQPTSTTQSFVSEEGTYYRYDTATNEFGIINRFGIEKGKVDHRLIVAKKLGKEELPIEKVDLPYAGYKTVEVLLWID